MPRTIPTRKERKNSLKYHQFFYLLSLPNILFMHHFLYWIFICLPFSQSVFPSSFQKCAHSKQLIPQFECIEYVIKNNLKNKKKPGWIHPPLKHKVLTMAIFLFGRGFERNAPPRVYYIWLDRHKLINILIDLITVYLHDLMILTIYLISITIPLIVQCICVIYVCIQGIN